MTCFYSFFRYQSIVTFRKTFISVSCCWLIALIVAVPPIAFSPSPLSFRLMLGGCWPSNQTYPFTLIIYNLIGYMIPILIVCTVNMKIVIIAKYHRFRIVNALFGITPFGPAEMHAAVHLQKERQKDSLRC